MENKMRRLTISGWCAAALLAVGCGAPANKAASASGSLALSNDDHFLYAADTDNDVLAVIDVTVSPEVKVAEVKVGKSPFRVAVGSDDTVYVGNRGERSVSVIRRGEWVEAAKVAVSVDPIGLQVSPDGKTLYVACAASSTAAETGSLTAVDTATLQPKWEIPVGSEPRGLALIGNDRAVISLMREGALVEVDLRKPEVTKDAATSRQQIYALANSSKLNGNDGFSSVSSGYSSFSARAANDVVVTPDGSRAFVPMVWAREDAIARRPSLQGGYYGGGGPCNVGAVATAGIITVDTSSGTEPMVDDLTSCFSNGSNASTKEFPPSVLAPSTAGSGTKIQGPSVAAIDPTGNWVFVVNKETSNVAVVPAFRRSGDDIAYTANGSAVRSIVELHTGGFDDGGGADGIALTRDGARAYVYSQFDHTVMRLRQETQRDGRKVLTIDNRLVVAKDPSTLNPDLALGRRLFFNAWNEQMSAATTGVACSTCHIEGRDDGHVWNFPDGPRQTPSLVGRSFFNTGKTEPYHWSGEFPTLAAFMNHTIRERMGGSGLLDETAAKIGMFIDSMPAPENPYQKRERPEEQLRGEQLFANACGTCHSGEVFTNNKLEDVGTAVTNVALGRSPDDEQVVKAGFNVPSLLGTARGGPWLHDGSIARLEERIYNNPGDKHGLTSSLSDQDKKDLLAYLKSL